MSVNGSNFTVLIVLFSSAAGLADPLTRADSLYALRAVGAEGQRAEPQPIAAAIAAYTEMVDAHPRDLSTRWRLLRALFFEAQYTGRTTVERKSLFEQARDRRIAVLGDERRVR